MAPEFLSTLEQFWENVLGKSFGQILLDPVGFLVKKVVRLWISELADPHFFNKNTKVLHRKPQYLPDMMDL